MRIPPQGQPFGPMIRPGAGPHRLDNFQPVPAGLNQSPLDALAELEQWRVKEEETLRQVVRWPLSQSPLMVSIDPYPQADALQSAGSPEALLAILRQWEVAMQGALAFRLLPGSATAQSEANIRIIWDSQTTLGRDYEVGHTNRQVQGKRIRQATITLITQPLIDAHLSLPQRQQRLYTTVLHEVGHALGLEHSDDRRDVMYYRGWQQTALSENDIRRIRRLYELD